MNFSLFSGLHHFLKRFSLALFFFFPFLLIPCPLSFFLDPYFFWIKNYRALLLLGMQGVVRYLGLPY